MLGDLPDTKGIHMNEVSVTLEPISENQQIAAISLLSTLLGQLAEVIGVVDDLQYTKQYNIAGGASIGGHVRHTLDHVRSLLGVIENDVLDYDARDRGTRIEYECQAAVTTSLDYAQQLRRLADSGAHRRITLCSTITRDGIRLSCGSSLVRETLFVVSHTIHHHALIAMMMRSDGYELPEDFGYAPATLNHRATQTCAL